jgi:NADH-quinone oxidoreductase subunit L
MLLLVWILVDHGSVGLSFRELEGSFAAIAARTVQLPGWLSFLPGAPEWRLVTVIGLCLFVGACGKSAQIPLYVWLPDAMAGPTPVSALIHAATMVTAGVYMVCRMSFLYSASPVASAVVAWTGALTALLAATIAIAQTDIKKVLAYSTVSQLGYMFLAAGCGGYGAAIFHLGTHAFFKALLFLGSGAVILSVHHEQDTDRMGGLRQRLRWTHGVFLIGVLAIAGVPGFSGFFSKDEVLLSAWLAHGIPGHQVLWAIGVGTAALTAFYMFRLHFRTFAGECRAPEEVREHIEEQGPVVLTPLLVLAFFSIFAGLAGLPQVYGDWVGIPHSNSMANFLAPVLDHAAGGAHHASHATELRLAGLAVAAAALGFLLAWWLYVRRPHWPVRIRSGLSLLHRFVRDKYYVDEAYDAALIRPLVTISDRLLFRVIDAGLIDGLAVNGTAQAVRALAARGLKYAHSGLTQAYLFVMLLWTLAIVGWLLR